MRHIDGVHIAEYLCKRWQRRTGVDLVIEARIPTSVVCVVSRLAPANSNYARVVNHRLRALIVEDSAIILKNLQEALTEMAVVDVVGTATAEAEACQWLDSRTQACDVAIVDLFLASGSGLGVLQHIAGYERPPERVVLTNYATDAMRRRCKELGAAAVFDKSTEIEQLVDWLVSKASD